MTPPRQQQQQQQRCSCRITAFYSVRIKTDHIIPLSVGRSVGASTCRASPSCSAVSGRPAEPCIQSVRASLIRDRIPPPGGDAKPPAEASNSKTGRSIVDFYTRLSDGRKTPSDSGGTVAVVRVPFVSVDRSMSGVVLSVDYTSWHSCTHRDMKTESRLMRRSLHVNTA
jgi:hypothetical protein